MSETATATKTATLMKSLHGDEQRLYRVDPPITAYSWDDDEPKKSYEFVVSSRCNAMTAQLQGGFEVYLFGADAKGEIIDWTELPGSQKHCSDLTVPLRDLGYDVRG